MSSDVVLLGGSCLVISPFSGCYINHEVIMLYQTVISGSNVQAEFKSEFLDRG